MECNKEEANRVKEMAKEMMEKRDFNTARRFVLKAQKLYSDLENISQMEMVCDVHCAAGLKLRGNETDWYGILKITQTADEATIKKQYRKFALLLHPDKNKYPGAEAAFKLIGEAQRVLLDHGKRSVHDMKRKASTSRPAPHQAANYQPYSAFQNNVRNNFTGLRPGHKQPQQKAQSVSSNGLMTFWTACPFCAVRYQYFRDVINKFIQCHSCKKQFAAYEVSGHGILPGTNTSHTSFQQQRQFPTQNASPVHQRSSTVDPTPKENFGASNYRRESDSMAGPTTGVAADKANGNRKRKKASESSESSDTESETDSDDDNTIGENHDIHAGQGVGPGQKPRRSDRRKRNVSYKENISDDEEEIVNHPKKTGGDGPNLSEDGKQEASSEDVVLNDRKGTEKMEKQENVQAASSNRRFEMPADTSTKNPKAHINANEKSFEQDDKNTNLGLGGTPQPEVLEYPDPEFNDFDKERGEECFKVGQVWAIYDTVDGMPRFYARIRRIFPSGFKVRITWLEPDPDDENEIQWVQGELPASCGKFKHGGSEITEDRPMFSHLICWEQGSRRDTYKVVPRKEEIWAVFKHWDIKWSTAPESHRKYEYEFVEILTEYAEGVGVSVAYLKKIKGFASVFCRLFKDGTDAFQIPAGDLYRFSHRVPAFKLTGKEREGVPKESYELDPASVPNNVEEIDVPDDLILDSPGSLPNKICPESSSDELKSMSKTERTRRKHQVVSDSEDDDDFVLRDTKNHSASQTSTAEAFEIPEPEFYNFDADKSEEKFQKGQIWSLYSDEEGLPKYYAQIQKIQAEPEFELHVSWLEPSLLPNDVIIWHDEKMPVCCGIFKVKNRKVTYSNVNTFSHRLTAESTGKRNKFSIFPKNGDVWAIYRNWSAELKYSELGSCEYDLVEVLDANEDDIEVLLLEAVSGFKSVFKASSREGSSVKMVIPQNEFLRFSHQIPAFRLTNQRDGSLRGFWELDPAALPVHYFS